ncbi:MAG: hypothetical protein ABGY42_15080 [bacterium]
MLRRIEGHVGGGSLVQFLGFVSRYYDPPRTFGAEVSYRFQACVSIFRPDL